MRKPKSALEQVSRLEVIDETGRAYTRWNVSVVVDMQDDGRTLKLLVKPGRDAKDRRRG